MARNKFYEKDYIADPLTRYSLEYLFDQTFQLSSFHKKVLGEHNVDIDKIYDICEIKNLNFKEYLEKISKYIFKNSNSFIKNKIIYKYFHDLGLEINQLIDQTYDNIIEILIPEPSAVQDKDKYFKEIKNKCKSELNYYKEFCNNEDFDKYFNTKSFRLLRILDDFFYNHIEVFNFVKNELTDTFNNTIKNCYRINYNRGSKSLLNLSYISNFNTLSTTSGYSYIDQTNYTTTVTHTNDLFLEDLTSYYSRLNPKEIKKKLPTSKKTPGIKILNKSLKSIRKFIPEKDLKVFLNNMEMIVFGKEFNWGFKLKNRKDLITYSDYLDSSSISWDLNLYTKDTDIKIARSCIVFKGCPILDQVLSVYLMIKSNREDEIIKNSNFFDKTDLYFKLIEKKEKKLKTKKNNNLGLNELNGSYGLKHFIDRNINKMELKTIIKNWIENFLLEKGFDKELYNYTTNLDVSFEEAVDYEAFKLFDIKVFDNLVKPLKWKKDFFRFKNKIVLDRHIKLEKIFEATMSLAK